MNLTTLQKIGIVAVVFAGGAISNHFTKGDRDGPAASSAPATELAATASSAPPAPEEAHKQVFDVQSLLGKSATQIRRTLGKPSEMDHLTAQQLRMGFPVDMTFTRNDVSLIVTYNSKTDKPTQVFLGFDHDVKDVQPLLQSGGLTVGNSRYNVVPVPLIKDPTLFTGVNIKPVRH